jgi:hypothetical protein
MNPDLVEKLCAIPPNRACGLIARVFAEERVDCDVDHHKFASFALYNEMLMCDGLRQQALRRTGLGEHFNPRARLCCRSAAESPTSDRRSNFWLRFAATGARSPATRQAFSNLKRAYNDIVPPPLSTIGG